MNPILKEESKELKKDLSVTANKMLDGLDIILEESSRAAKKVWKDTEEVRTAATRKGLSIARNLLERAEKKFL